MPVNQQAIAMLAWLVVGAAGVAAMLSDAGTDGTAPYVVFWLALMVGSALTVATLHSAVGDRPWSGVRRAGFVLSIVAVLSTFVAWALPFWMTLFAVAFGLVAWSAPTGARAAIGGLASAYVLGMAAFFVATAAELGDADEYGDYPAAFGLAVAVTVAVTIASLYALDRRTRATRAAEPA